THPDPTLKGGDFSADPLHDEGYVSEARFRERYGSQAELYWPKICAAADYAAHYVLTWEGEPALAVYHAMSAGSTEASDNVWETALPYLVSVKSEGDTLSPDYCSSHTWLLDEMHALLKAAFPAARLEGDPAKWLTVLARSEAGYVTLFSVGGVQVPGQQVRKALSLRSTCLLIEYANGTFSIETKGYGHGVGLSQNGADFLARQGSDAADILAHYYPGTTLTIVTTSDAAA
ncbi:MAG: SpoIID/LytB domain-containing protein, partial [Oscillospiraceae bacterium]